MSVHTHGSNSITGVVVPIPARSEGAWIARSLAAVLLASDEGTYYIGATMNVNGGDVMV